MKKLTLNLPDFLLFRQICELYRIYFEYEVKRGGIYNVTANANALEAIGY